MRGRPLKLHQTQHKSPGDYSDCVRAFYFPPTFFSFTRHEGHQLHTELLQSHEKGANSLMNPFSDGQKAYLFPFLVKSPCPERTHLNATPDNCELFRYQRVTDIGMNGLGVR